MVYVDRDTPYMKLLQPFLEKKKVSLPPLGSNSCICFGIGENKRAPADWQKLALDSWGCDRTPVNSVFDPIHKWMLDAAPSLAKRYPSQWKGTQHIDRVLRQCLLSVSPEVGGVQAVADRKGRALCGVC